MHECFEILTLCNGISKCCFEDYDISKYLTSNKFVLSKTGGPSTPLLTRFSEGVLKFPRGVVKGKFLKAGLQITVGHRTMSD